MNARINTGLDLFKKSYPKHIEGANIGLLIHPASINSSFKHALDLFAESKKFKLKALFGPQHGIKGETQDNMIEWEGYLDRRTGIPVYSLYGKTRSPDHAVLKKIDVLIIDLQDIGARYYTFIWTLALVMRSCQEFNKTVIVLDRPNPIGGHITEGPILDPEYASFVGLHPLPVRHGMTIGEIALYMNDRFYPKLKLHVVPMKGWSRHFWFDDTKLPWVFPSPNMPTLETATVYPGMCLLEGTNLSEGRGTTKPFEIFGAPFIDPEKLLKNLKGLKLQGVIFRSLYFIPTFHKYSGKLCGGAQVHVLDREKFRPFKTAAAILKSAHDMYPENFQWNPPPYEYENILLPIDILAGNSALREDIENSVALKNMESCWNSGLREFDKRTRRKYLLY